MTEERTIAATGIKVSSWPAQTETYPLANIDSVVQSLRDYGQKFLLDVIGSKEKGLKPTGVRVAP